MSKFKKEQLEFNNYTDKKLIHYEKRFLKIEIALIRLAQKHGGSMEQEIIDILLKRK